MARVTNFSPLPGGLTPKTGAVDSAIFTTPVTVTTTTDYGFGVPLLVSSALSEDAVVFGLLEANNTNSGHSMHALWAGEAVNFYGLGNVVFDAAGNAMFPTVGIGGQSPSGVWRLTPGRQLNVFAGSINVAQTDGTGTAASLYNPSSIALASDGNYYIPETGSYKIRKMTPGGVVTTLVGNGNNASADGTTQASFANPRSIVFNAYDNCLYVFDGGTYKIRKVTLAGVVSTVAGNGTSAYVNGNVGVSQITTGGTQLASDGVGGIYFTDNQTVRKMDTTTANYTVTTLVGLSGTAAHIDGATGVARFTNPYGCVWDTVQSCLWVHDCGASGANAAIRKVTSTGTTSTLMPSVMTNDVGQHDGPPTTGFTMSAGQSQLGFDPTGWIWISDGGSARLRRVNTLDGRINHVAGHNSGTNVLYNITGTVQVATRIATVGTALISQAGKQGWLPFPYPVRVPAGNKLWVTASNISGATTTTASLSLAWSPISLFQ